jgi:F0F1-type ATP synthase assembly protein I
MTQNQTVRGVVFGAMAGAVLGAIIGWVYTATAEEAPQEVHLRPFDFLTLGAAMFSIARQVGELSQHA